MNQVKTRAKSTRLGELEPEMGPSTGHAATTSELVPPASNSSLRALRAEAEINAIHRALEQTGWNRKQAAKVLSISYRCLLYKIRRHDITPTVEHS